MTHTYPTVQRLPQTNGDSQDMIQTGTETAGYWNMTHTYTHLPHRATAVSDPILRRLGTVLLPASLSPSNKQMPPLGTLERLGFGHPVEPTMGSNTKRLT